MTEWTEEQVNLAAVVGAGRHGTVSLRGCDHEAVSISIDHIEIGGGGVILSFYVRGQLLEFWVDDRELCRWIEPSLIAPTFSHVSDDLHAAVALWALAPLIENSAI